MPFSTTQVSVTARVSSIASSASLLWAMRYSNGNLAGRWDPSLAFVMAGAISVGVAAFALAEKRDKSLLGETIRLASATHIERRLILGGLAFGAGWGLAGYCPGPALASLTSGGTKPLVFSAAMLAGMTVFTLLERLSGRLRHEKVLARLEGLGRPVLRIKQLSTPRLPSRRSYVSAPVHQPTSLTHKKTIKEWTRSVRIDKRLPFTLPAVE